jgi:lipoate---protein ligase
VPIEPEAYDLPDAELVRGFASGYRFLVWQPDRIVLVLGHSNPVSRSVIEETVIHDDIALCRRPSGGQAVLLTPAMLAVSAAVGPDRPASPYPFFTVFTFRLIQALERLGITGLSRQGISDITLGGRKIAGSAIHQNRERLFYHAVLNIGEPGETFKKYLLHPQREPEYRRRRPHEEFVTSLRESGYPFPITEIARELNREMAPPPIPEDHARPTSL